MNYSNWFNKSIQFDSNKNRFNWTIRLGFILYTSNIQLRAKLQIIDSINIILKFPLNFQKLFINSMNYSNRFMEKNRFNWTIRLGFYSTQQAIFH